MRSADVRVSARGVAALVIALLALGGMSSIRAQPVVEQPVDFGVPRREVVSGVDVEFACRALATSESMTVLDAAEASSWIGLAPGPCAITAYVLDVRVPVPILNTMPLGRFAITVPGVAGFTFGVADVSIDLVTGLAANYTGLSPAVSLIPTEMAWSTWGAKPVTISAHSGGEGSSLRIALPYRFSIALAVGVTVYALGVPVFQADLADVGTFQGAPDFVVPVTVDLRPSRVASIDGWAPSAAAVQVNWTPNQDDDFASYRVRLEGSGSGLELVVDAQGSSTVTMPAMKGTSYTVSVTVVDRAGQLSAPRSVLVRTPGAPDPSPPADGAGLVLVVLAVITAFGAGFGIAWSWRRRPPN